MKLSSFVLAAALVAAAGCTSPFGADTRDPISAGTAKLFLEKGKTKQTEVLEAFGGPNIVAGDSEGNETWTYDRMSYVSETGTVGGAAAGGAGAGAGGGGGILWFNASRASTSSRTVTLYLYWQNGVLNEFRYRSATF